uniref:Uncharacterized protein n=1 Tax=Romanomermis culicivorax TaxID=13658 RepID=A0A915KUU2_ROMCU
MLILSSVGVLHRKRGPKQDWKNRNSEEADPNCETDTENKRSSENGGEQYILLTPLLIFNNDRHQCACVNILG